MRRGYDGLDTDETLGASRFLSRREPAKRIVAADPIFDMKRMNEREGFKKS